jgi:lipoic acid synthetase
VSTSSCPIPGVEPSLSGTGAPLQVRQLGRVEYSDAWALQRGLHSRAVASTAPGQAGGPGVDDHLLLLEHPHTYTLGRNADRSNVGADAAIVGAEVVEVDRGGDVTYHGPGQLVAYPLVELPDAMGRTYREGGLPDSVGWVCLLEQVLIDTVARFGITAARHAGYPGVWVGAGTPGARKIAAIGVRVERGRTLHGVALNVEPDMSMFDHIVPCGITEFGVTSMAEQSSTAGVPEVAAAFEEEFTRRWKPSSVNRAEVTRRRRSVGDADLAPFSRGAGPGERTDGSNARRRSRTPDASPVRLLGRLADAGVEGGVGIDEPKPEWMRARFHHDESVLATRRTVAELDLVTVCEEAGCPNLSECWSAGTATFMLNGERCTRACGFCLVDTRKPEAPDPGEPTRVAEAVRRMGLDFAVLTTVARDDLPDEGAGQIAETIRKIRRLCPGTGIEVLISDCRGRSEALDVIFGERPDVMNHNIETVARLQRAVRPSAGYARSLSVLARSVAAGLTTKSGMVVGMGETREEIHTTLADLAAVGTSIVTIGQYLRPTTNHLPVAHWWTPADFEGFAQVGRELGIAHVESSPFTRSSHHAAESARAAAGAGRQGVPWDS